MNAERISENQPFPVPAPRSPAPDVTGWKLDEARKALANAGSTRALPVQLIETAAPARKNSNQTFGDWRVLRVRRAEQNIELTIARELLTEERRAS